MTSFKWISLDLNGLDNWLLEEYLGFPAFWLNTVNIDIDNSKSVCVKVIEVLNLIKLISTKYSLPNLLSLLFMESIISLAGNSGSYLCCKSIAHISDKITDIENSLGILLVIMINIEFPIVRQPNIQTSVIRSFDLHKIFGISWTKEDMNGFNNTWSFRGWSRKTVYSELLIWFEHNKARTKGYSTFPGVEVVDLNCTVEGDLAVYGSGCVGSFVTIELREQSINVRIKSIMI